MLIPPLERRNILRKSEKAQRSQNGLQLLLLSHVCDSKPSKLTEKLFKGDTTNNVFEASGFILLKKNFHLSLLKKERKKKYVSSFIRKAEDR